jgi:NADH:ubiquinone oxidoreductase subunit 3 (subunit A)
MPQKFKLAFYNFMIFLIIFDIIYLVVWVFSIQMNPVKAVIIAGITAILTPWAKETNRESGRKVVIRIYAFVLYKKFLKSAR